MNLEIEKRFLLKTSSMSNIEKFFNPKLLYVIRTSNIIIKYDYDCFTRFRKYDKTIVSGNNKGNRENYFTMCTKIGSGLIRQEYEMCVSSDTYKSILRDYKKEFPISFYIFDLGNNKVLELKEVYNPITKENIYLAEIEFDTENEVNEFDFNKLFDENIWTDVTENSDYNVVSLATKFDLVNEPIKE